MRKLGITIFVVEQNVHRTLELADYAYVMENGRIVLQGKAATCAADPRIRQAYLGPLLERASITSISFIISRRVDVKYRDIQSQAIGKAAR